MTATQEDIDAVLEGIEGPEMKATVRRGGNFSIQYKALKDITAQYDAEGEETQSRDEVLMRHQLAVVDALKAAGLPHGFQLAPREARGRRVLGGNLLHLGQQHQAQCYCCWDHQVH